MRISENAVNRLKLLKSIRRWSPVARTDIAERSGIPSSSMTHLTAELLDRGLIVERKEAARGRGRPRKNLEINACGSIVIGSSLIRRGGSGYVQATFIDLMGQQLHSCEIPLATPRSLRAMADAIADALATAIVASPFETGRISRVGISLPAMVDTIKGEIHYMTTYPTIHPVPFADPISARVGLPVTIENDVTCMARAEHWFGRADELDTFTLIHVGSSIGAAEYVDGLPKSGANGLNSELGHIKSEQGKDARACYCGAHGCLSAYASIFGVLNSVGLLDKSSSPWLEGLDEPLDHLLDLADAGDERALSTLDEAGTKLGVALANHITANDPGNILVVVDYPRFLEAIREPLEKALRANTRPSFFAVTEIRYLVADKEWFWRGAAALALEQTYLGDG